MLNHTTLTTLRQLRLPGMAQALEEQITQPPTQALAFEERLGLRRVVNNGHQRTHAANFIS